MRNPTPSLTEMPEQGLNGARHRVRARRSEAPALGAWLVAPVPRIALTLPLVRNNRTRVEAPAMAERLIAALPESERAFWALAFMAGISVRD